MKKFINIILLLLVGSCTPRAERLANQAEKYLDSKDYLKGVELLEEASLLSRSNENWSKYNFEIARILRFEIQDYNKALLVLRKLILKSENADLRLKSQMAISDIYFENLQDYPAAIKEYLLLEPLIKNNDELITIIKFKIAQSYKYLGNYDLALDTIETAFKLNNSNITHLLKLKGQILQSKGNLNEALNTYVFLLKNHEKYFFKDNVYIDYILALEEKQDFTVALDFLKKFDAQIENKNFIDFKLKRFTKKQIDKPLAKGLRK